MTQKATGLVKSRMDAKGGATQFSERPPFPRNVNIELNNVCNHACRFCAYPLMEREHGNIDTAMLEQWLADAYRLGSREIGLHSGAEPFASKQLEHFVAYCKNVGYEYIYISTNASLANPVRMAAVIDAGIDSIKFSINAGDRETYLKVHGNDHFDRVLEHLRFASTYRGAGKKPYLAISFVVTRDNEHTVEALRELTRELVDEFIPLRETNSSGQLPREGERALKAKDVCAIPFNKLHISWEGYMRVCCNDYENVLAVEDLRKVSLEEAFYGDRFTDFRRRHLEDRLEGSLCFNCKYDCKTPIQPLNPELYFTTHGSDKGPPATYSPIIFRK